MGCLYKQPTGVVLETGGWGLRKVSESTLNRALLPPFAVTSRRSRDARINQRIDSLPCPALFSMFPGRQVRDNLRRGPDSTKQQRSACAGSNYGWIMQKGLAKGAGSKWEVVEGGRTGGRGCHGQ